MRSNILGGLFVLIGAVAFAACFHDMAHCSVWIIAAGAGLVLVGGVLIDKAPVLDAITSVASIVAPLLKKGP